MATQSAPGPLRELRVVDLSTGIAGPYATKLLADAGAEVVKVEARDAPDPMRWWSASQQPIGPDEQGALFAYLNAGKRGVALDLGSPAGREALFELATLADVVVESAGPGGAEKLGLAWPALHARNPALSLVSISPWGLEGPWAERPATEFTLQAAVGSTAHRGLPSRGPVAAGGRIGEWIAGTHAGLGALVAWRSARRSGSGHHVDLSMFESLMLMMTIYHDLNGQFFEGPLRQSVETPSIEPARDGWVGLCTITGQQWKDFCALIGRPDLAEDERFYDATARMEHLEFIHEAIHAWTREHDVAEIVELCQLMRIPANPLGDGKTLPAMEHFVEREVFVRNPAGFVQPRPPYRLHGTPGYGPGPPPTPQPAPRLGEHAVEPLLAQWRGERPAGPARGVSGDARPFAGLRVVDLTAFWAGPVATSVLGDLGADVVKIESIQRPDGMRFAGSVRNDRMWEFNPIFHGANTSKRGITLRLDSEPGRELLWRLIDGADVVIENFSVRVLENFGIRWEDVHARNPRAILVRMPSFGLDGPWRDRVGFAMNIEQVSGLAWMTGYEDMPLVVRGACDPLGGMHAVFALGLALEERERSGLGQLVELPLVEPAVAISAEQVIEYSAYGAFLQRQGNRGPAAAPQGVYPCRDPQQFIALAVADDAQWQGLLRALGDSEQARAWAADASLAHAAGRRAAHDAIDAGLRAWLAERERDDAVEALLREGVPAHPVVNAHFVWPNPQLEARAFFQTLDHAAAGRHRYPGLPMAFSGLPRALHTRPPPLLGEHNEEVLGGELGLSREEIERLREAGVIGERPSFL